jgi:hypothetical protein
MAVIGTPVVPNTVVGVTVEDVRWFLRDYAGQIPGTGVTNILLDGVEFSDDDIRRAVRFTVSRWNGILPITTDTEATIPDWLLMVGTCEILLQSEAHRQNRNALTYADGNISPVGLDDKMQQYVALAQALRAEFEEKSKLIKVSRNMESMYGSLGSGYRISTRYR